MPPLETPVPATGLFTVSWLLIAIPALSAAILLLVGRRAESASRERPTLCNKSQRVGLTGAGGRPIGVVRLVFCCRQRIFNRAGYFG